MRLPLAVTDAARLTGAWAAKTLLFAGLAKATPAATGCNGDSRLRVTLSMNTVLSPPARSVPTKVSVWVAAVATKMAV